MKKHINSIYHETTFSKYCYRIYLHTDRSGTKSLFQLIRQMEFPDRPGRYRRQGTMVQKIPRRFYQPARLHARKTERRRSDRPYPMDRKPLRQFLLLQPIYGKIQDRGTSKATFLSDSRQTLCRCVLVSKESDNSG